MQVADARKSKQLHWIAMSTSILSNRTTRIFLLALDKRNVAQGRRSRKHDNCITFTIRDNHYGARISTSRVRYVLGA